MLRGDVKGEVISSETNPKGNAHIVVLKEDKGRYVNHLAVEFFGKTLEAGQTIQVGDVVRVSGFVASREWQGRWFTAFKAMSATVVGGKVKHTKPAPSESDDPADDVEF